MAPPRLDEASLKEPLRRLLTTRAARTLAPGSAREASVLVALFDRDAETHVWLVRRPRTMRSHAGQVAFPGGKRDPTDAAAVDAALREAHEELGISPASVDVLGPLDELLTITGFAISPFVGWLAPGVVVTPSASEVARAFSPPLRAFLEPPTGMPPWRGWIVEGELVWGATAGIVRGFVSLLRSLGQ